MFEIPEPAGDGELLSNLDPKCFCIGGDEHKEFVEHGWIDFWAAYEGYLLSRGYELYKAMDLGDNGISRCQPPSTVSSQPFVYPYAATNCPPNGMWERPVPLDPGGLFPSVMPILDIVATPHDFSFVVMPRWGILPVFPGFSTYHPDDINHGEFDYDPFAFDVALMGNVLSSIHLLTPAIPLLAPLLDRMTTHVVEHRFTAAEAHKFCVAIKEGLSVVELNAALPPEASAVSTWPTDRWAQVSPEFVRAWSSYRKIPPPFHLRLLGWIARWDPAFKFLRLVQAAFQV
ncbi:hypothetical protein BD779DRAFT_1477269 [Infundibulicybe gibba]|nr:hypothetical protein BD779DRAFT_1477269 [Infundibulicybe gibba]